MGLTTTSGRTSLSPKLASRMLISWYSCCWNWSCRPVALASAAAPAAPPFPARSLCCWWLVLPLTTAPAAMPCFAPLSSPPAALLLLLLTLALPEDAGATALLLLAETPADGEPAALAEMPTFRPAASLLPAPAPASGLPPPSVLEALFTAWKGELRDKSSKAGAKAAAAAEEEEEAREEEEAPSSLL